MNYIITVLIKGKEKKIRVYAESLKEALSYLTANEKQHIVSYVAWKC